MERVKEEERGKGGNFILFLAVHFILEYSGLTILCQFQVYSKVIHVSILIQILFAFRLLHNIGQSSLRYTVGTWLPILFIFKAFLFCIGV